MVKSMIGALSVGEVASGSLLTQVLSTRVEAMVVLQLLLLAAVQVLIWVWWMNLRFGSVQ